MENSPTRWQQRPSLTDDLIFEIFVRLPAKSVGRFRCVSKRWLSDLTDPNFIRAHSSRSPTSGFFRYNPKIRSHPKLGHTPSRSQLLAYPFDSESRLPVPTLSFLDINGLSPEFLDCCNGLILCCSCMKDNAYVLAVCNPLTRDCHFIPVPEKVFSKQAFLVFDPSVSTHFKVVSVCGWKVNMFIYSSETRKWKLLAEDQRTKYNSFHLGRCTHWNGNLVWNSFEGPSLCLDTRSEQLKWLPLPVTGEEHRRRYLGESGGRLHFIGQPVPVTHESVTHFDIWELMPGSTEWSLLYKIDIEHINDTYPEVNAHCDGQPDLRLPLEVVHFFRDEGGVGDRLLLSVPGKIVCYHLRDKSFTTICNALPVYRRRIVYSWRFFYRHAHTLSPLNASTPHKDWVCWKSKHDELLIRLMVENSLSGKKNIPGFEEKVWHDMVEKFNEATQLNYEVHHLRDRFKSYKRDFQSVARLLRYNGFHWNPEQKVVTASDANWKRQHPLAEYKRKQVPFRDLEIIFASPTTSDEELAHKKEEAAESNTSERKWQPRAIFQSVNP